MLLTIYMAKFFLDDNSNWSFLQRAVRIVALLEEAHGPGHGRLLIDDMHFGRSELAYSNSIVYRT